MTQTLANNLELTKEIYACFERGDIDAIINDYLASDVVWVEPDMKGLPEAGTHKGPENVKKMVFGTIQETYGDLKAQPSQFFNAGEAVIVTGHFSSRKIPSTGKRMEVPFCHVMQFKNGRVSHMQNYSDTYALAKGLGL